MEVQADLSLRLEFMSGGPFSAHLEKKYLVKKSFIWLKGQSEKQ